MRACQTQRADMYSWKNSRTTSIPSTSLHLFSKSHRERDHVPHFSSKQHTTFHIPTVAGVRKKRTQRTYGLCLASFPNHTPDTSWDFARRRADIYSWKDSRPTIITSTSPTRFSKIHRRSLTLSLPLSKILPTDLYDLSVAAGKNAKSV
jgi:hypothetical protein